MTRHVVTTRQASIDTGVDGHGPAVVVIPSYGRDAGSDFDLLTTALVAAGYRVLRPQPRGVAGSSGPMIGVTFADMAGDIAELIDGLADGPAVILGHAFGNFVARATAVRHPDMVTAVILAAASGRTVDPQINSAPMRAGDLTLPDATRLAALRLAFFAAGHDASIWLTGWYPETLAMQVDCVQRTDVTRYWGAGAAPVFEMIAASTRFTSAARGRSAGPLRRPCHDHGHRRRQPCPVPRATSSRCRRSHRLPAYRNHPAVIRKLCRRRQFP